MLEAEVEAKAKSLALRPRTSSLNIKNESVSYYIGHM